MLLAVGALYAFDGPPPRPGEPSIARLATGPPGPAFRVPSDALLVRDRRLAIFVEVAPATFARRAVTLVARRGPHALVVGPVREGERIVIVGGAILLAEESKPLIVVESEGGRADDESPR